MEDAEIFGDFILAVPLSPGLEGNFRGIAFVSKVECVKDERLAFGKENSSEGFLGFAVSVHVRHIDDVQVAGAHQVPRIAYSLRKLSFAICGCTFVLYLLRKLS